MRCSNPAVERDDHKLRLWFLRFAPAAPTSTLWLKSNIARFGSRMRA